LAGDALFGKEALTIISFSVLGDALTASSETMRLS
jgi:hypothetical protein